VSCPSLTAPNNGTIDCTGSLFEDTCTFLCDDGYELTGSENRTCQSNRTWSGTEAICTRGMQLHHSSVSCCNGDAHIKQPCCNNVWLSWGRFYINEKYNTQLLMTSSKWIKLFSLIRQAGMCNWCPLLAICLKHPSCYIISLFNKQKSIPQQEFMPGTAASLKI